MSKKDQKNLDRANRYIQQKDYAGARFVLEKMPDNPTARQWLAQLNQISPVQKKRGLARFDKADAIGIGITVCILGCISIIACLALGQSSGVIQRGYETKTAEAKEKEAARSTDSAVQDMTATIIALTPSSTPTATNTATDTPRPTRTPTITATSEATIRPSSTVRPVSNQIRYTTQGVNVRKGAGTTFDRIGSLPAGYKLTVLGEQDGWYKIEFNNGVGWVAGEFTSTNAPSSVSSSGDNGNSSSGNAGSGDSTGPSIGPTQFVCPRNCDGAVQMGLTAQQAAACGLDRDGDGEACYGN